jgi:hypothetical protein
MNIREFIERGVNEYLNESSSMNIDFSKFPSDILKTLQNEYGHYYLYNFDWNSKQDEFRDNPSGFTVWLKNNKREEFIKNLDKIISKVREDLILLIRKRNAEKVLEDFENLIIPVLGNSVLVEPLSMYMEIALLNLHSVKEIEAAFKDAQNIIDKDGSINYSKITPSTIFSGGGINLPKFERFARSNPEYAGVFNDWKKLFDKSMELSIKELNAFRNSTPYSEIRKLHDYLIKIRNNKYKNL